MADVAVEGMAVQGRRSVPRTIVALIVLWVAVETLRYIRRFPDIPLDLTISVSLVFQFIYAYLLVALIAYGLLRGSRFAWIVAFVWQGLQAGFAFLNLDASGWDWNPFTFREPDRFGGFDKISFYDGPFPVIVAAISFALLLAPPTRRWINDR